MPTAAPSPHARPNSPELAAQPASDAASVQGPLKVLLIDTSEKGALPLYTAMVAQALAQAGALPVVLANVALVDPQVGDRWRVRRELKAGSWPPPAGAPPPSATSQLRRWVSMATSILRAVISERPDVIHFQHPLHPRLDALLVRTLSAFAPVVWTAHDVLPHDTSSNGEARAAAIYRASALTLVHNPPAAAEVHRLSGVSPTVIRHPVRSIGSPWSRADARTRLGVDPLAHVACAVGFIRAYKGYGLLADALEQTTRPDLRLLIVGQLVDSTEQVVLDRLASDPRTDLRIGYASEDDLIAAIASSDVMLLPHVAGSDSGSLHMSRALGVPVLASDAPQLSSVVNATGAGKVLPRDPTAWAAALEAAPPPCPPAPPTPLEVGLEHLGAYATVLNCNSMAKTVRRVAD